MGIYNFDPHQQFSSIDKLPDHRDDGDRLNSPLSLFNHDSMDLAWAERQAEELINLSGAWLTIFKMNRKTGNRDEVWDEDADPTFRNGKKIKGWFAPKPAEAMLKQFGVDIENDATIFFSRANVLQQFGKEMIAEGDIIIVPHNTLHPAQSTDSRDGPMNRIDTYKVMKATDTGNFKYRWLYWSCSCQNILGDPSMQVDHRTEPS